MEMCIDMRWYLAGPMSNIPQFNFPAFYAASIKLRELGYEVISPAEMDDKEDSGAAMSSPDGDPTNRDHMGGKTWGDFLSRDVKLISDKVSGIIFLPGWYKSKGAKLEAYVGLLCKHKFALYDHFIGIQPIDSELVLKVIYEHT